MLHATRIELGAQGGTRTRNQQNLNLSAIHFAYLCVVPRAGLEPANTSRSTTPLTIWRIWAWRTAEESNPLEYQPRVSNPVAHHCAGLSM